MKALITGANSLVNQVMLEKLVAMGYEVVAHYHSDNGITASLKKKYSEVTFAQADFANKESFEEFLQSAKQNGPYEVIVNGAVYFAEAASDKPQKEWNEWQKTFAINTTAPGAVMAHAKDLVKTGVIINISSTYGQKYMGDGQFTMYGASKAALDLLTENYAKKLYPNVRVVGIAPGWVRSAWNKDMSEKDVQDMVEPVGTALIEPTDIANLMEQLINNRGINATTLLIDSALSSPTL